MLKVLSPVQTNKISQSKESPGIYQMEIGVSWMNVSSTAEPSGKMTQRMGARILSRAGTWHLS